MSTESEYKAQNKKTIKNRYPIPRIDELMDELIEEKIGEKSPISQKIATFSPEKIAIFRKNRTTRVLEKIGDF